MHVAFPGGHRQKVLTERLKHLGILRDDIIEKFIRASGPGGQCVNKVSSCVYLKHLPTSIEVKSQNQRSQALNRLFAWELLVQKIEQKMLLASLAKRRELEKTRRQKRGRSALAKRKIAQQKIKHSQKKYLRRGLRYSSAADELQ